MKALGDDQCFPSWFGQKKAMSESYGQQIRMTPRERKDMPWLLRGFAVIVIVMLGSAVSHWL
jgi:cytochrome c-type biogenesis protein CcmH/NrfF